MEIFAKPPNNLIFKIERVRMGNLNFSESETHYTDSFLRYANYQSYVLIALQFEFTTRVRIEVLVGFKYFHSIHAIILCVQTTCVCAIESQKSLIRFTIWKIQYLRKKEVVRCYGNEGCCS